MSPNGTDEDDCCGSIDNPCGTLGKARSRLFETPYYNATDLNLSVIISGVNYLDIITSNWNEYYTTVAKCSFGDATQLLYRYEKLSFEFVDITSRNEWFPTINGLIMMNASVGGINSSLDELYGCESFLNPSNNTGLGELALAYIGYFNSLLASFNFINTTQDQMLSRVIISGLVWDWDNQVELDDTVYVDDGLISAAQDLEDFMIEFKDCQFRNIDYWNYNGSAVFSSTRSVSYFNCLFENIHVDWEETGESDNNGLFVYSRTGDSPTIGTSTGYEYFTLFNNCTFKNIATNQRFERFQLSGVGYFTTLSLINSNFENIDCSYGMFESSGAFILPLDVTIQNTIFNNISNGFILNIKSESIVDIDNIYIQTSQYCDESDECNDKALFRFGNAAVADMNDIEFDFRYEMTEEYLGGIFIEWPSCLSPNFAMYYDWLDASKTFYAQCVSYWPVTLVENSGTCSVSNINASSDFNLSLVNEYGLELLDHSSDVLENSTRQRMDAHTHVELEYIYDLGDANAGIAVLFNEQGGDMIVDGFICDHSSNQMCITNKGTLHLNNFQSDFAANGSVADYEPDDLMVSAFVWVAGDTYITNSNFRGFSTQAILATDGILNVNSSTFSYGGLPLYCVDAEMEVYLSDVIIEEFGSYYSSFFTNHIYSTAVQSGGIECIANPLVIRNSFISGYHDRGVINVQPANANWDTNGVPVKFVLIDSVVRFDAVTGYREKDEFASGSYYYERSFRDGYGVITIGYDRELEFTFINNTIYNYYGENVNFSINGSVANNISINTSPLLHVDLTNVTGKGCLYGNTFIDYAIYLQNGTINSCRLTTPSNLTDKCWSDLDQVDDTQYITGWGSYDNGVFYLSDANLTEDVDHSIVVDGTAAHLILTDTEFSFLDSSSGGGDAFEWSPVDLSTGYLSFVDVILIDNDADDNTLTLEFNAKNCTVYCLQILDWDWQIISQLQATCDDKISNINNGVFDIESLVNYVNPNGTGSDDSNVNFTSLADLNNVASVSSLSPKRLELEIENCEVYPGGSITLTSITLYDSKNNIVEDYDETITVVLTINQDDYVNSSVYLNEQGEWMYANGSWKLDSAYSEDVFISGLTIDDIGKWFTITVTSDVSLLTAQDIRIYTVECPAGFGTSSDGSSQCAQCSNGYFSLDSNIGNCYDCGINDLNNAGVECDSQSTIIIEYNNWMGLHTEWDADRSGNTQVIISSDCPTNYCCQNTDGCDFAASYITNSNDNSLSICSSSNTSSTNNYATSRRRLLDSTDYNLNLDSGLCAYGRDPNIPLCGKCRDGFSEYLGTTQCGPCENGGEYGWLIIPFILSFMFTFYLTYFTQKSQSQLRQIHKKKIQEHRIKINKIKQEIRRDTLRSTSNTNSIPWASESTISTNDNDKTTTIIPLFSDATEDSTTLTQQQQQRQRAHSDHESVDLKDRSDSTIFKQLLTLRMKQEESKANNHKSWFKIEIDFDNVDQDTFSRFYQSQKSLIQIMIFRPLTYYMQAIGYLTSQNNTQIYLAAVLNVFTFSYLTDTNGGGDTNNTTGFCFIKGMTAIDELASNYLVPCMFGFELLILYFVFNKWFKIRFFGREAHMGLAFWQILLVALGVILSTVLKFLSCRSIPKEISNGNKVKELEWVLYYAGYESCFFVNPLWTIHLVFLIFVIVTFIYLYFRLKNTSDKIRNHLNFGMKTLVYTFQAKYWYWEFVLFSRRLSIAALTTFSYASDVYFSFILLLVLCVFLILHCYHLPFKHFEINFLEGICLFLLIALFGCFKVIGGQNTINTKITNQVIAIFLTIFILIPIIFVTFFGVRIIWVYFKIQRILKTIPSSKRGGNGNGNRNKKRNRNRSTNRNNNINTQNNTRNSLPSASATRLNSPSNAHMASNKATSFNNNKNVMNQSDAEGRNEEDEDTQVTATNDYVTYVSHDTITKFEPISMQEKAASQVDGSDADLLVVQSQAEENRKPRDDILEMVHVNENGKP